MKWATVRQIEAIVDAGVDLVRVSVPTMDAADAFGRFAQRCQCHWSLTSILILVL